MRPADGTDATNTRSIVGAAIIGIDYSGRDSARRALRPSTVVTADAVV